MMRRKLCKVWLNLFPLLSGYRMYTVSFLNDEGFSSKKAIFDVSKVEDEGSVVIFYNILLSS